jgi:hypothetical protein
MKSRHYLEAGFGREHPESDENNPQSDLLILLLKRESKNNQKEKP